MATITGTPNDDFLFGTAEDDVLQGLGGNDALFASPGADRFEGGEGNDHVSYAFTGPVIVYLTAGQESRLGAEGHTFVGVENVLGSPYSDTLFGDDGPNLLQGFDPRVSSSNSPDLLYGHGGDDTLIGSYGDDTLVGGAGADLLSGYGGSDVDTASYASSPTGVIVDLTTGAGTRGDAEGDRLFSIENLEGSGFGDLLIGDGGANTLRGLGGDDVLDGRGGADTVVYPGNRADYLVEAIAGGLRIADLRAGSPQGTDTVLGVESFSFADRSYTEAELRAATNRPAVAVADAAAAAEDGGPVAIDVLANDTDPDSFDTKSLVSVDATGLVGTAQIVNGAVVYDPGVNFQSLGAGQSTTTSFTYTMRDAAEAQSTATVTITVAGANDAPVAVADAATAFEDGGPVAIDVLANDTDPDSFDTKSLVSVDATGLVGTAQIVNGAVVYDPGVNFQSLGAGQSTTTSFTYTMRDAAEAQSMATVTIKVVGANDAPAAAADAYATSVGQALTVAAAQGVLANDADVDAGDALGAALVQGPASGTLALNADGSFTYTPGVGFLGTDGFTYRATDAAGAASAATTVSIGVLAGKAVTPPALPPAGGGPTAVNLTGGDDGFTGTGAAEAVYGLGGNDVMDGGAGDDTLDGGAGRDRLIGGPGHDLLTGGPDADTFVFGRAEGRDAIVDFSTTGGDVVELPANLLRGVSGFVGLQPYLSDVNGSAVLDLGANSSVTFQGVAAAQLAADDFAFV